MIFGNDILICEEDGMNLPGKLIFKLPNTHEVSAADIYQGCVLDNTTHFNEHIAHLEMHY